jgi:ketosteroid isomerase-like protein
MKPIKRLIIILSIFCLGVFCNFLTFSQEWSDKELEVWAMEKKYWEFWINGDIEGYMTVVHDDFIGWPASSAEPMNKEEGRDFVEKLLTQTKPIDFDIKPTGISIIDNTAIVHYFLIWKDAEGNEVGNPYRITHTWIKQGEEWKVIGGMSAD